MVVFVVVVGGGGCDCGGGGIWRTSWWKGEDFYHLEILLSYLVFFLSKFNFLEF